VPYQRLLDGLVRAVPGAQAALLMDAEGELVVEAGDRDFRARLIGAYQGIALATARRTAERYAGGRIESMFCRYSAAHLILRSLRDGYYIVLSLDPRASTALALHHMTQVGARVEAEF